MNQNKTVNISIKLEGNVKMSQSKSVAFVLMSFHTDFDDLYELGIKAACQLAGVDCARVDEQIFVDDILNRIYAQIENADVIISEMTGKNSNVFYETGYAHALHKRVILLAREKEDIPFDLTHYPHIIYHGKIAYLKSELEKKIKWHINNPVSKSDTISRTGRFSGTVYNHLYLEDQIHSYITIPIKNLIKTDNQKDVEDLLKSRPFKIKVENEAESFIMNAKIFNKDEVLIGEIDNPFYAVYKSDYIFTVLNIIEGKLFGTNTGQKLLYEYVLENYELVRRPNVYWWFIKIPNSEYEFGLG